MELSCIAPPTLVLSQIFRNRGHPLCTHVTQGLGLQRPSVSSPEVKGASQEAKDESRLHHLLFVFS